MEFDGVFHHIGHFGKYHLVFTSILFILGFFSGYQNMAMNFLGPKMDHWCKVEQLKNFTIEKQKYIAIPLMKGHSKGLRYSQCERFDLNFSQFTATQLYMWNRTMLNQTKTTPCDKWEYDRSMFSSAATSEVRSVMQTYDMHINTYIHIDIHQQVQTQFYT